MEGVLPMCQYTCNPHFPFYYVSKLNEEVNNLAETIPGQIYQFLLLFFGGGDPQANIVLWTAAFSETVLYAAVSMKAGVLYWATLFSPAVAPTVGGSPDPLFTRVK